MFFSENQASKKRGRQKKRDRNIYGIFGNSDSDNSEIDTESNFNQIIKDYEDSNSNSDEYYSKEEERNKNFKKTKIKNKYNKKKNDYKEDFSGFVSGGTLKGSEVDGSSTSEKKDNNREKAVKKRNLNKEMNSDEELLNKILDYDDYVLVEEDEELLMDKRNQLRLEKRIREQYEGKRSKKLQEKEYIKENEVMKEDKMEKIYGKGLNMLKKMGYKGGALGKEGKGLLKPLSFSTSKINKDVYKIEEMDKKDQLFESKLQENDQNKEEKEFLESLENKYKELYNKRENTRRRIKELNDENMRLKEEVKELKTQVERRIILLEKIKVIMPKIESNYREYLETLNKVEEVSEEDSVNEIVERLVKLLKQLNKIELKNKLSKGIVKLTFEKLFKSKSNNKFYEKLTNYNKLFESLKKISSYINNNNNNREMKEIINYYMINELIDYYQNNWDPLKVEEGFNKYNYLHKCLYSFYNNNNEEDEEEDYKFEEDGLKRLLNEVMNKLLEHIENLKIKDLYNCHIIFFPWLEFLNNEQIDLVVNLFLENLFKNSDNLITFSKNNNNNNNNSRINSYGDDDNNNNNMDNVSREDKIKKYENVYNNWNKLMSDKSEFRNKLSHKLLSELSSINSSLMFNLEDVKSEALKELVNEVLNWKGLIGEENMIKLLLKSILELFVQFLSQLISSMNEKVRMEYNSGSDEEMGVEQIDSNELKKELKEKREKIIEYYLYFKSLFPDYINKSKQVQEHCYRRVLNNMESFTKSYVSLVNSHNYQNSKEENE